MILIFGGTTEGRRAVETLERAGKPFYYSTLGSMQKVEMHNGIHISGNLDAEAMESFCRDNEIRLLVDAAHPFASRLHATVAKVAESLGIPVVRYERIFPDRDKRVTWCDDYADACRKMEADGAMRMLGLSGANTIAALKPFWSRHESVFRVLDRDESRAKATDAGFDTSRLVYLDADTHISDLLKKFPADAIITKESGESGGFEAKTEDALAAGLKVYVVKRPRLPESFITVEGPYGLRKQVERILPDFYDLRSGFTTGSCVTAAAKGAMLALLGHRSPVVEFRIPDGERLSMRLEKIEVNGDTATAEVVKDAGDDPDVTHRMHIFVTVRRATGGKVTIIGKEGVGRVTLSGLGLPVGDWAINPVPRMMISRELLALSPEGCIVEISIPDGASLALKTFNPRVGVEGGISIIGTSGVVMPFSNEAFLEAIKREMQVALAAGNGHVVLNSGARSERYVHAVYPDLPASAFVHYGNAVGETLEIANELDVPMVTIGVMLGKAVKLAEGNMDTHSHKVTMNHQFLHGIAKGCGCSAEALQAIDNAKLARELWSVLSCEDKKRFMPALLRLCYDYCRNVYSSGRLEMMLIEDAGGIFCRISDDA